MIKGDMFGDSAYDVLIHGCNCFNTMGAGVAALVKKYYPAAADVDRATEMGNPEKLGSFTFATVQHVFQSIAPLKEIAVVNAYTQYQPGRNYDYTAIHNALTKVNDFFPKEMVFGLPKIGAGIAGGDWETIKEIMEKVFVDRLAIVYYID